MKDGNDSSQLKGRCIVIYSGNWAFIAKGLH